MRLIRCLAEERARILLLILGHDLSFAVNGSNLVVICVMTSHLPCSFYRIHLKIALV